jgi:simple sugar transport system substrate-binding protein
VSVWGLAGCARRGEYVPGGANAEAGGHGVAATRLLSRSQVRIEMPTHMEPQDPNTAIMQNGADQAAKDFGVKVNFRGPDKFSIPAIQKIFDASIASKPTAIAATLPDANALGPKIQEAVSRGIPVVLFNAGLDDYKRLGALTYVGQTELTAGQEAGQRLSARGLKNVIVINHQQGQLTLETRAKGVQQGVRGGTVKEFAVDGSSPTTIKNGVAAALRQNKNVQALLTLGPGVAEQAMAALDDAGRTGQVKLATFDISPAVLQGVKTNKILFAIDQQMFFQTYMSVMSLVTYSTWRLRPVTAVPSGPLFVDAKTAPDIITLSAKGIH